MMFGLSLCCLIVIFSAIFLAGYAGMAWLLYITNPKRRK